MLLKLVAGLSKISFSMPSEPFCSTMLELHPVAAPEGAQLRTRGDRQGVQDPGESQET